MFILTISLGRDANYQIVESYGGQEITRSVEKYNNFQDLHTLVSDDSFAISIGDIIVHAIETDTDLEYA